MITIELSEAEFELLLEALAAKLRDKREALMMSNGCAPSL
jgi:hypothetical protein